VTFDVVLEGGRVVDGTGGTPFKADVGLVGDRIDAVGDLATADARERIDVTGLAVAPGFIDVHTHSDVAPRLPDDHVELRLAAVRQGVTTEICGNCGFSTFPSGVEHAAAVHRHVRTLFGASAVAHSSLDAFREDVSSAGLVTNLGSLVGHGTIRASVLGFENRPPTREEVRESARALEEACEQGALGFSSGLIYAPGVYADTAELVELSRVAAKHGVPYVTHMRDEADGVDASIDEALRIGVESGAAVQISHHKVAGKDNWGRTAETVPRIEAAREHGVDVAFDVYPYTAGSTMLAALLPPWANEGGIEELLARLRDRAARDRLRKDFSEGISGWQNLVGADGWDNVVIATAPTRPQDEGKSVRELAAGGDEIDAVCEVLLAEDARVTVVVHMMAEEDVERVLASPLAIIGSDGIPLPGKPHPRWTGSFARVLGEYVRRRKLLSLEEAVHKMTGASAARFGLERRGVVAAGAAADIAVFDADAVVDRGTYAAPLTPPVGVRHTLVNGVFALRDGEPTPVRAGRFLSR
jgi:N-acyl-D-aspartate/D-glutamate deacylase